MGTLLLASCARHPVESPDERIRRQAAESAKQVHRDVQAAGVEAKRALGNAERTTRDIVAGAREGWRQGGPQNKPHPGAVDINHASAADLATLPGMKGMTARRIANGRPYAKTQELVVRGLLTQGEYDRIQSRLTAN